MVLEVLQKDVGVLAEGEEIVLLLEPFGLDCRMEGAVAVDQLVVGVIVVAVGAVPAGVGGFVDVAVGLGAGEKLLRGAGMARLGGTYEGVDRDIEGVPSSAEGCLHAVGPLLRGDAVVSGGAEDVLAVLVETHAEGGVVAEETVVASDDIGGDFLQGVADVGGAVGVIDGGGNVAGSWCDHDGPILRSIGPKGRFGGHKNGAFPL